MSAPHNDDDFDTAPDHFVDALETDENLAATIDPLLAGNPDGDDSNEDSATKNKLFVQENDNNDGLDRSATQRGEAEKLDITDEKSNEITNDKNQIWSNMKFFINREEDAHDNANDAEQLVRLIKSNGGEIIETLPIVSDSLVKDDTFLVVSPYNDTNMTTVSPTYIKACVNSKKLLDYKNFIIPYDEYRSMANARLRNSQDNHDDSFDTNLVQDTNRIATPEIDLTSSNNDNDTNSLREEQIKLLQDHQKRGLTTINTDVAGDRNNSSKESSIGSVSGSESINKGEPINVQADGTTISRIGITNHNKASFTEDEDEFILDVVRKNPTRRTTHTLFDEISHYVPNHTGNSIRHRYRIYLSKRLDFVYEVDSYGKLVRDERGGLIKTKVLPPVLKRKFTAEDDYELAMEIKKQFYRDIYQVDPDTGASLILQNDTPTAIAKRRVTMDPNHVPGTEPPLQEYRANDRKGPISREFFKKFGEAHQSHSENAWRDRFRKFLLRYGVDQYIDYYEEEKRNDREPKPMKNLTIRKKRPGLESPGNYSSLSKRSRPSKITMFSEELESESPSHNSVDGSMGAHSSNSVTDIMGNKTNNVPRNLQPSGTEELMEEDLLDEETLKFITTLRNDLSKLDSAPFEYPQDIADSIRREFTENEKRYDEIDPNSIPWPPAIATKDLFFPEFFQMGSVAKFIDVVNAVISEDYEPQQGDLLVESLSKKAGIHRTFCTSILTALSGDLMVFPRYFLSMFATNSNPPVNIPGIWTHDDDNKLRGNDPDDVKALEKKHGAARVEMRKKFIERELI